MSHPTAPVRKDGKFLSVTPSGKKKGKKKEMEELLREEGGSLLYSTLREREREASFCNREPPESINQTSWKRKIRRLFIP